MVHLTCCHASHERLSLLPHSRTSSSHGTAEPLVPPAVSVAVSCMLVNNCSRGPCLSAAESAEGRDHDEVKEESSPLRDARQQTRHLNIAAS